MLEHMKKHHTEMPEQIILIGPAENREAVIKYAKKKGFIDKSESIPWREAFPDYDENKEGGECLAGARYRDGITQRDLAKKTGIPQRHISEMENGKRPIGKKNAKMFADFFNTDYRIFL